MIHKDLRQAAAERFFVFPGIPHFVPRSLSKYSPLWGVTHEFASNLGTSSLKHGCFHNRVGKKIILGQTPSVEIRKSLL